MMGHLVLRVVTKLLIAPILLFAFYVQWHGDFGPGGGFQAGVIFAVAIILYAIVFGLEAAQKAIPPWTMQFGAALGVLIYAGTGVATVILGGNYLDYDVLVPNSDHHAGQHYGILIVELGVGVTVASVMVLLFYAFAGREPEIDDADW
ncbi:MAG: Na(+)/H(+) antiporter subunit B [Pseudomonadota bacterium]